MIRSSNFERILQPTLMALAIGTVGGIAAHVTGLPAGLLAGSMAAVAAAAIFGASVHIPNPLRHVAFVLLGIVIGSAITPETLHSLPRWPISLTGVAIYVVVLMVVLPAYLTRQGLDITTARLAAIPGALAYVLALSVELDADTRRVAILQTLRLTLLLMFVPLLLSLTVSEQLPALGNATTMAWGTYLVLLCVCTVASIAGHRIGVPTASLVVSMFVAGLAYGLGWVEGASPAVIAWPALITTGALIGARFAGIDRAFLFQSLRLGVVSMLIAGAISLVFAFGFAWLLDLPLLQVWLAFSPGGLDSMTVLAFSLGVDPAFVAGHQFLRFLGLSLAVPFLFARRKGDKNRPFDP